MATKVKVSSASFAVLGVLALVLVFTVFASIGASAQPASAGAAEKAKKATVPARVEPTPFDNVVSTHAKEMLQQGRQTFRYDTFGSEAFWGDKLQLHKAIA